MNNHQHIFLICAVALLGASICSNSIYSMIVTHDDEFSSYNKAENPAATDFLIENFTEGGASPLRKKSIQDLHKKFSPGKVLFAGTKEEEPLDITQFAKKHSAESKEEIKKNLSNIILSIQEQHKVTELERDNIKKSNINKKLLNENDNNKIEQMLKTAESLLSELNLKLKLFSHLLEKIEGKLSNEQDLNEKEKEKVQTAYNIFCFSKEKHVFKKLLEITSQSFYKKIIQRLPIFATIIALMYGTYRIFPAFHKSIGAVFPTSCKRFLKPSNFYLFKRIIKN